MDDREQQRKVRHRLAVLRHAEEVTGSVSATCRYYRHQSSGVLQVATPVRRRRRGGSAGPVIGSAAARGDWFAGATSRLGHEGIGVVEALGDGARQFVAVGDRVILGLGGAGGPYWCGACSTAMPDTHASASRPAR
jgi:hypothetical protein